MMFVFVQQVTLGIRVMSLSILSVMLILRRQRCTKGVKEKIVKLTFIQSKALTHVSNLISPQILQWISFFNAELSIPQAS